MGLGQLFTRDVKYSAVNTSTGESQHWSVSSDLVRDFGNSDYDGGMGLPGAWRAARIRSSLTGGFPWHAYRDRGGVTEKLPAQSLLDQPEPPDPRVVTFSALCLDLVWHGNAIGLYASRNRDGWPTSLVSVSAEDVRVKRITPRDDTTLPVGSIGYRVGRTWFSPDDVLHIKGPSKPGALRGMGVLENHFNTLSLAQKLDRQARSIDIAAVPTGILKMTDSNEHEEEDARKLKSGWQKSQRDRTVQVLNPTTDYVPLAWNPEETQLLEARKFSLHELALIFDLEPTWLGVSGDSRTYQNQETKGLDLLKYSGVGDDITRFEQTLSLALPRGTWVKANLDGLLRSDTLTRYQAHAAGITAGFLLPSEARAYEDLPPVPGIDNKEGTDQ
jgi:HK97 family phage portal protein